MKQCIFVLSQLVVYYLFSYVIHKIQLVVISTSLLKNWCMTTYGPLLIMRGSNLGNLVDTKFHIKSNHVEFWVCWAPNAIRYLLQSTSRVVLWPVEYLHKPQNNSGHDWSTFSWKCLSRTFRGFFLQSLRSQLSRAAGALFWTFWRFFSGPWSLRTVSIGHKKASGNPRAALIFFWSSFCAASRDNERQL